MSLQELLKQLQDLEFTDLVNLYLEAKTGKHTTAEDLLPLEIVDLIYSLDEAIKEATDIQY
jgi:hypothetical protein